MTVIQWTDETWNPSIGCTRVSSGCQRCYAERAAAQNVRRLRAAVRKTPTDRAKATLAAYEAVSQMDANGQPTGRWNRATQFRPECLGEPLKWRTGRMVFVCSMSDLFHEDVADETIAAIFGVMAACPQHVFQVLTKRPERAKSWFEWVAEYGDPWTACHRAALASVDPADRQRMILAADVEPTGGPWPLPNVWLGVSVENRAACEARLPILFELPAALRWASVEPLLGPVRLGDPVPGPVRDGIYPPSYLQSGLDWVVVGGESGSDARVCDIAWVRRVVDDCRDAHVPVFVKQLGARPFGSHIRDPKGGDPAEWPEDIRVREWPVRRSA